MEYVKTKIYADENLAVLEQYEYDPDYTACYLLGTHCRGIAFKATAEDILKMQNANNDKNIERIAQEMSQCLAEKNLKLLEAFMDGFQL